MKNNLKINKYAIIYKSGGAGTQEGTTNPYLGLDNPYAPPISPISSPTEPINSINFITPIPQNVVNNLTAQIKTCKISDKDFCLVDFNEDSILNYEFYPSKKEIKGLIKGDSYYINENQVIGQGSFGSIIKLVNLDFDKKDFFVLKKFNNAPSYLEEKLMSIFLKNLNPKNKNINIVESYWYENVNNYILLNGMKTDLERLSQKGRYNPYKVFLQIVENVYNLYKNDMYYVDLKLGNCLFKFNKGKIDVTMGDIGGIVSIYKNENFNLFKSKDIVNTVFKITDFKDNFFKLYLKNKDTFYSMGYVDIGLNQRDTILELVDKELTVMEIEPEIKIKTETSTEVLIKPLYFISKRIISTFPHFKCYKGVINIDPSKGKTHLRTLCINNIFHSLVICLLQLIQGPYFDFTQYISKRSGENISVNPELKFSDLMIKLTRNNQTNDVLFNELKGMIYGDGNGEVEPMFNLDFNESFNDPEKINKVFENCIKIVKKYIF